MYAAAMGEKQTVALFLERGADLAVVKESRPYQDYRYGRTFINYAIARGHWGVVLDALGLIRELYVPEALDWCSKMAILSVVSIRPNLLRPRTAFSDVVKYLADVNMCFGDGYTGVEDNNLMHYVSDVDEAFTLLQCGCNRFNSRNSDGKLAINSLTQQCDPALIKFCIENGTDLTNKDSQGRTILFDLFCHLDWATIRNGKMWAILDAVRLCLDGGVDIFEKDHCRCPCSPGGCTIFSIFSINFPSLEIPALKLGPLWSLEWVTLVEEHCGEEAARQVLLILFRRAKCDQPDIYINHVCCHRGRGIDERQIWQEQPRPLLDEDITEILDEEREFIDILEAEIDALDSNSFQSLRSRWILTLKEKYDAHVEAVNQVKGKRKLQHPEKHYVSTALAYNDTLDRELALTKVTSFRTKHMSITRMTLTMKERYM